MFSKRDLECLDSKYFEIIYKDERDVTIMSKNTRRMWYILKAGIMNGFNYEETEEGSGQGSVCSPILSCIYMHYVLLWWFKEKIQPEMKGFCGIVNYADDFV